MNAGATRQAVAALLVANLATDGAADHADAMSNVFPALPFPREQGRVNARLALLRALLCRLSREDGHAPSFARTAGKRRLYRLDA
jgi:hypothetical protein